jgi:broad specificity phosphatase PhoE
MTRFVVVRHGETLWNLAGRVQGHADSELSPAGRAQAEALARRLAREPFDMLVSSDLGRAMATARAVAQLTAHDVLADPRCANATSERAKAWAMRRSRSVSPGAFARAGCPMPITPSRAARAGACSRIVSPRPSRRWQPSMQGAASS